MRKTLFVLISMTLLSSLISGCAGVASAQTSTGTENPVTRTISVSGSGKAVLTPDIASISIGVHTENKSAAAAVSANNAQTQAVADTLKEFGIEDKDIQTTNFSIYPQQQYDNEGKPTGEILYMVDNTVYVTVHDLDQIGDLLDAVVEAGANTIGGIQFDVEDKTAAMSAARKAAVTDAKAIAEEMAAAAGVSLGEVQTMSIYGGSSPRPVYDLSSGVKMEEAASVPISPGQLILTVEVSIVYEIR
jgi:uncharacterized protein